MQPEGWRSWGESRQADGTCMAKSEGRKGRGAAEEQRRGRAARADGEV